MGSHFSVVVDSALKVCGVLDTANGHGWLSRCAFDVAYVFIYLVFYPRLVTVMVNGSMYVCIKRSRATREHGRAIFTTNNNGYVK